MALPPELQALNITPQQVAALLTHLQAGTLPFPPPPPPPQAFNSAGAYASMPMPPLPVQNPAGQGQPVPTLTPSRMDVDREEGEVSDAPQEANHTPPAPMSKKRKLRASQLANRTSLQTGASAAPTTNTVHVSQASLQQKRDAVLPFIAALHHEGFTFDEFIREGFEENLLRQVYQELRIAAIPDQPITAQELPAQHVPAAVQPSAVVPVKEVKSVAATKPTAPVSRQDYLARLQAAKTKKIEAARSKQPVQSVSSSTPPQINQETTKPPAQSPIQAQPEASATENTTAQAASAPSKQAQTTELIRKKMEALRATQRRLANSATPAPSNPALQASSQVVSQSQPKPTPTPPSASTPSMPSAFGQGGSASLIPGLRMSTSVARSPQPESQVQPAMSAAPSISAASAITSKSVTPQSSEAAPSLPTRKRPVASDLNEARAVTEHRPFKRPFGQSRQNSPDEGMIIQVSDDEETSDDDNERSNTKLASRPSTTSNGQRDRNIRDLPPLRDFPQRATFNKQPVVFTPPLGTPGAASDAEELRRKEMEITSLNQRIKEYEKRKAALKAKAQLTQSQPQTPQLLSSSEKTTALTTPTAAESKAPAAVASKPKQPADRRTELKAALTARDADIVDQKARILEMQRQMAEMQKQYDEDMEKQRKLREELESLDVDTEGMTQSEMEAKKQELDDLLEMEDPTAHGIAANTSRPLAQSVDTVDRNDDMDVSISEVDSDGSSNGSATQPRPALESPQQSHRPETFSSPGRARVLNDLRADRIKAEQARADISESNYESDSGSSMSESSESEDEESQSNGEVQIDGSASVEPNPEMNDGPSKPTSAEPELMGPQNESVWLYLRNLPFTVTKDEVKSFFRNFDV